MERHVANAQRVAGFLEAHDAVDAVNYPGLPSSRWHAAQQKYAPKGAGAVLTFELHGGVEAGKRFVEALELHSRSEEHTSELQSRQYLVCRLLLEKKTKNY